MKRWKVSIVRALFGVLPKRRADKILRHGFIVNGESQVEDTHANLVDWQLPQH